MFQDYYSTVKTTISISDNITHVICSHGHMDHIGNLSILDGTNFILVGYDLYQDGCFKQNSLRDGIEMDLTRDITIIPTPGHTDEHISVLVKNTQFESHSNTSVLLAGDLFERSSDDDLWRKQSSNPTLQKYVREYVLNEYRPDFIIPGHGRPFRRLPF